jgi:hypothetical protein
MPSSLNGTGVTFNDGTQLNSANDAGGNYIQRVYNAPATWTKPAGLKAVKVTVVGGGGGGGGIGPISGPAGGDSCGLAGGGGGASIRYIPAPSIPGPVAVTVGAGGTGAPSTGTGGTGGTSSYGAFLSATGGAGGVSAVHDGYGDLVVAPTAAHGAGGTGSGGDVNINGERLSQRANPSSTRETVTAGSFLAQPQSNGLTPAAPSGVTPGANSGIGSGARAVSRRSPAPSSIAGAAGGAGIVIVEEFY